jgi:hypothetical protein
LTLPNRFLTLEMSRSLIVSLNITLKNPSARELLHASSLLILAPPLTPVTARYSVLEGDTLIRTDKIRDSITNSVITSQLSMIDYNTYDLNVRDFLKRMA